MIENSARVARVEGTDAWIEASRPVGCGHCHENPACSVNRAKSSAHGAGGLIKVANPIGARPGEFVVVGVLDGAVWRVALWVYLVPLGLALSGALLGSFLGNATDQGTVLGAGSGLAAGFLLARLVQKGTGMRQKCRPAILRREVTNSE